MRQRHQNGLSQLEWNQKTVVVAAVRSSEKEEEEDSAADLPCYFRLPKTYGEVLSYYERPL